MFFVSTNYFSNNFVFKAKALLEIAIFVQAVLLCPQAETAFVETKNVIHLAETKDHAVTS
jgi:hypothetical protein